MFRRNLFKHFLPVALSVAMTVQSVPVTSYAAETQTVETETAVAEESEEASDEQVGNDGEEAQSEEVKTEETKAEETKETSEEVKTEETKTEETKAEETKETSEEVTTEEAKTEETKTEETNKTSEEVTPEEENKASEETKSEEEKIEAQAEEEIENNKAASDPAEIIVNQVVIDEKLNNLKNDGDFNYIDGVVEADYNHADEEKAASKIIEILKQSGSITVKVGAEDKSDILVDHINYKWQQKNNDKFEDMAEGTMPKNAGEYQLVISVGDVENVCKASTEVKVIGLKIKAVELKVIPHNEAISFNAGTTVAEVIAKNALDAKTKDGTTDTISLKNSISKDVINTYSVEVRKASGGSALAPETVLEKNEDYVIAYIFDLKDEFKSNYTVSTDTVNIKLDAVQPTIKVELADNSKPVGKEYDGTALSDDFMKDKYTAKVVYTKDGRDEEIKDADIKKEWYTGENAEADRLKCDAPVDAGTYFYKLTYSDPEGSYLDAEAWIRVVIDPIDIVIDPVLDNKEIYEGMEVVEIVKNAKYDVYKKNADGTVDTSKKVDINEYFWGTAYDEVNNDTTQSYEPVFFVQKGTKKGDIVEWDKESLELYDDIEIIEGVSYRLVFSGKKAVYDRWGNDELVDINASQKNYTVDLTDKAIDDYAEILSDNKAKELTIDVSKILENGAGASYDNAIQKTYSGEGIYKTKDQYKQATVKDAATDSTIEYEWEQLNVGQGYEVPKDKDNKDDDSQVPCTNIDYQLWNVEKLSAPKNAGEYRLKIKYTDPTHKTVAKDAYVYYTVLPQNIKAVVTTESKAFEETSISNYVNSLQVADASDKLTYANVAFYKCNDKGEKSDDITSEIVEKYSASAKSFKVERKVLDGEAAGTWTYDDTTFKKDNSYRLNSKATISGNYNLCNKLDKHGYVVKDSTGVDVKAYENETADIAVVNGISVKIDVINEADIQKFVKEYDNTGINIDELKKLVKITTVDGGADVTAELEKAGLINYTFTCSDYEDDDNNKPIKWTPETAVHAGKYTLTISVGKNEKYYAKADKSIANKFEITPKELVIMPNVKSAVKAETFRSNQLEAFASKDDRDTYAKFIDREPTVTGFVSGDGAEEAFYANKIGVYEDTAGTKVAKELKSGERYYVKYLDKAKKGYAFKTEYLYGMNDYANNIPDVAEINVVKGSASLDVFGNTNYATDFDCQEVFENDVYIHTLKTLSSIKYMDDAVAKAIIDPKASAGNYFIFKITAPDEITDTTQFVYENAVKSAGGYVVSKSGKTITVAFEASKYDTKSFEIIWKQGYTEKFVVDFAGAALENDFSKAVAPKSLSFNGVNTKMAVGERQQLNVNVTKKQMADIILLKYESDNEAVQVTDKGYVTAVKKGAATITVTPCYKDADGKKVAIAGAKSAKVKINVTDLAVPKINKVVTKDTYAEVQYVQPANGYRREIYVLEGKRTVNDFESEIANVKNGDYSAFVDTFFVNKNSEDPNKKGIVTRYIGADAPQTEYTVYVRNVSGLRTLNDGAQVEVAHTGAVKTFKTTKSQAIGIEVGFDENQVAKPIKGARLVNVYYDDYVVSLSDKSAQLSTQAQYLEKPSKGYSDDPDYIWRLVGTEDKNSYVRPKIVYYADYSYTAKPGYTKLADGMWISGNGDYATVAKNGKVTFKGKGWQRIWAYDTVTGNDDYVWLYISSEPTSIKGKPIKLAVGQTVKLSDYLEYMEGKMKVAGYQKEFADLDINDIIVKSGDNDYFDIVRFTPGKSNDKDQVTARTDYYITALKPGGKLELMVADKKVANSSAKIAVSSSAISAVKSLKATNIVDKRFDITFDYPEGIDNPIVQIDLRDERGSVIDTVIRDLNDVDSVKKGYQCKFTLGDGGDIFTNRIKLLSTYNVTVTAIYGDQYSKPAKIRVKTTNIPASYADIKKDINGVYNDYESTDIIVTSKAYDISLCSDPKFVAGNKYTLELPLYGYDDNKAARDRKTDTITWKIAGPKVATIKANPGTFTATLKTVKKGVTFVEAYSKVTKKMIARYPIIVNAVGDADSLFGENEPYRGSDSDVSFTGVDEKDIIELTSGRTMNVKLDEYGEKQWFVFTAPAYGKYTFEPFGENATLSKTLDSNGTSVNNGEYLEKGVKRYYLVEGYNNVSVKVTAEDVHTDIALGDTKVKGNAKVRFIAPEDNYYTIKITQGDKVINTFNAQLECGKPWTYSIGKSESREYNINVTRREPVAVELDKAAETSLKKDAAEQWFVFTAPEDGRYIVSLSGVDQKGMTVSADAYDDLKAIVGAKISLSASKNADDTNTDNSKEISMIKGSKIYVKTASAINEADKTVKASLKITKAAGLDKDNKAQVKVAKAGEKATVTYVIPKDGFYRFNFATSKDGASISANIAKDNGVVNNTASLTEQGSASGKQGCVQKYFNKGDVVVLALSSDKDDTTIDVSMEEISTQTLVNGENKVKLTANITEPVTFTALEDGWYSIAAEDKDKVTISGFDGYYEAGKEVAFNILCTEDKAEAKVTITKAPVGNLVDGDVTLNKAGETKYFKYTAEKEGTYEFSFARDNANVANANNLAFRDESSSDTVKVSMNAGQTIYVRMTTGSDTSKDGKVTVAIKMIEATSLTAGKEASVKVAKNSSEWVTFTAPKKARYQFNADDTTNFEVKKATAIGNAGTEDVSLNNAFGILLDAGQKVIYEVKNTNTTDEKTVKLTIKEVDVKKAGETVSLKDGQGQWFVFTSDAKEATRYTFKATASTTEANKYARAYLSVYNSLINVNMGSNIVEIGDSRYVYVTAYTDAENPVSVKLDVVKSGSDGELTKSEGYEIEQYATKEFTYTAPEDGTYAFSANTGDPAVDADVSFIYVKNLENSWKSDSEVELKKGDKLVFNVTNYGSKAVIKFAMTKLDIINITSDYQEIKIKSGETKRFALKTNDAVRYFVETTAVAEGLTITGVPSYGTFIGTAGGKQTYSIDASGTFEGEKTFKIRGGAVISKAVEADKTETIAKDTVEAGHYTWYSFEAPEDGRYTVKVENAEYKTASSLKDRVLGDSMKELQKKGDKTYFAVYSSAKPENDLKFTVNKVVVNEISKDKSVEATEAGKVWVKFTAPEDGYYTISAANGTISSIAEYEKFTADEAKSVDLPNCTFMKAGEEHLYAVTVGSVEKDKKFTLSVAKEAIDKISANTDKEITIAAGRTALVEFTTEKDVICTISDKNNVSGITYKALYDADSKAITLDKKSVLKANTKILMAVSNNNEAEAKVKLFFATEELTKNLELNKEEKVSFTETVTSKTFVFEAPADGQYTFKAEADKDKVIGPVTMVSNVSVAKDKPCYLAKGDIVRITVEGTKDNSGVVKVTTDDTVKVGRVAVGAPIKVTSEEAQYYAIEIKETAEYKITKNASNLNIYVGSDKINLPKKLFAGDVIFIKAAGSQSDYTFTLEKVESDK